MKRSIFTWLKGMIEVELRGGDVPQFLNEITTNKMELANIRWIDKGQVRFEINVEQFFLLRKYVRASGGKIKIIKKTGLPFFLVLLGKRIWFSVGLVSFFTLIFILSSLVWKIEVEGNKRIPSDIILSAARQEGLYLFQWSFRLQDADVLSKKLVNLIPGTTWIGVNKTGTNVTIQIVESTIPDKREKRSPRHLVASHDAVVSYIIAEEGKPVVQKNSKVRKGDILISGVIGGANHSKVVIADGQVKGLVWYEYTVSAPITKKYRAFTGERQSKSYIVLGKRAMQFNGFGQEAFQKSETTTTIDMLSVGMWTLPIGKMKELVQEVEYIEQKLTIDEVKKDSLKQARLRILAEAGQDAQIVSEIVLHEAADNGKVVMKVLYEIDQSIIQEQPIVQMQGD